MHHIEQVKRRLAAAELKKLAGIFGKMNDIVILIHQHTRRRILFQHAQVQLAKRRRRQHHFGAFARGNAAGPPAAAMAGHGRRAARCGGQTGDCAYRSAQTDRARHRRIPKPQQQQAIGPQHKMKQLEQLLLDIAIKIDQQIPAGDHVQLRERRIAQQIMTANSTISRISFLPGKSPAPG